jgi:hypothetical protein
MGKGGMRLGAGRPGYKVKAEHLKRIFISKWHRLGYLQPGNAFGWAWHCEGVKTGSIGVSIESDQCMRLAYSIASDGRDASQRIGLERTQCHFGGTRAWFCCPRCNKRTGVLYLRLGRFACRKCQQVAYTSQSVDEMARAWLKQRKLEDRLGEEWERPKGMRQRTYNGLLDSLEDCQRRRDAAFCEVAQRFLRCR